MISSTMAHHDTAENAFDDFLDSFADYSQTYALDDLRHRQFARLDEQQHVYLDYAGGSLYPCCLVRDHTSLLEMLVLGNPHSKNSASLTSSRLANAVRRDVLRYFNADPDQYAVIFTANASAALKLVGEGYPFNPGGHFLLTADNHNSVQGIREFARKRGAPVTYIPPDPNNLRPGDIGPYLIKTRDGQPRLFAYPAQSNFSGVRHPLSWVEQAQACGYDVLLDAAAFVPTNRLDLSKIQADFVSVSFYKMFGYPTGVGALIARRASLAKLSRPWFAGGTVRLVSTLADLHIMEDGEAAFEEGTINYLSLPAVSAGLVFMEEIGVDVIQKRVMLLLAYLLREMRALRHRNGHPVIRIYGPAETEHRGAVLAFNIVDSRGLLVPHNDVEIQANLDGISIRSGCFCNPGSGEYAFRHTGEEIQACCDGAGFEEFSVERYSKCLGDKAMGAVRVSLGMVSNFYDVHRFIKFIAGKYIN